MHLTIQFRCDSTAFEDDAVGEIERILGQVVSNLDMRGTSEGHTGRLLDSNGKTVGDYVLNIPRRMAREDLRP